VGEHSYLALVLVAIDQLLRASIAINRTPGVP
jgi:hypothetical protein